MVSDCVECVLCRGLLPNSQEDPDILLGHMKDYHRVFANLALFTSACLLDQEGINATLAFITSRTNSVKDMLEHSDPLEMAEEKENSSSETEDPDPAPATMEELPDISCKEESENSLDIDEKSFNVDTVVNEVSMEDSRSEGDPLESYQDILLSLESSQSEPHTENQKTNISALESLSEQNPEETDGDGEYFHSKRKSFLTLQDLQLYRTDHSYSKLKSDNSSYSILKKKTKKNVLKSRPAPIPDFDVAENSNNGLPMFLPEPREKNINQTKSETKTEEEDDIPDEEFEANIKNYLSRNVSRREKLLALCYEECGEKRAREANDNHLRRYHAGVRLFPCAECPMKFKKSHKLETHKRLKHTQKSNICDICGKYFANVVYVVQHKKTVHLLNQESQTCDLCGKVFRCRAHLKKHKEGTHSEKHQCQICGIKMRPWNYNDHLASVHGREDLQKHICDICQKGFFVAAKMKEHRLTHGDVRPFPCRFEGCDFASKSSGNRKKHEDNKHSRVQKRGKAQT